MQKLLIAVRSDDQGLVMKKMLSRDFQVTLCYDGPSALVLARNIKPDAMILDLFLPKLDGLTLLQQLGDDTPTIVLALTDYMPEAHVLQYGRELGIGYYLSKPYNIDAVYRTIAELSRFGAVRVPPDPITVAVSHLLHLGFKRERDGFKQLRLGIPLLAQDPYMRLEKELYAQIHIMLPNFTASQIERSIRSCIRDAWDQRDPDIWEQYFPGCQGCPSNKKFITRLAAETTLPNP